MAAEEHKKRRCMGKRNLMFIEKICHVTKGTSLSRYHNRLLYEFSKIRDCRVLEEPPCCRTVCLRCFRSHNITDKTIRIRKRTARHRCSSRIDQIFTCKLCGGKELSRGFVPTEYKWKLTRLGQK